jgi:hypothetical protein
MRATYTPRTRRSLFSSASRRKFRPQEISRSHQGDDVAQREIEARITLQEATERANIGQHGGSEPVLGKAPASTIWTTGHLHFHGHYVGCGAISFTVTFLLPPSSVLDASLSLNWPPRFDWERSPSSSSPHITRVTARRDNLAAAEHGPIIRFDQRHKSVLAHFFLFANAASARDRVSAASSILPHPHAAHRDTPNTRIAS